MKNLLFVVIMVVLIGCGKKEDREAYVPPAVPAVPAAPAMPVPNVPAPTIPVPNAPPNTAHLGPNAISLSGGSQTDPRMASNYVMIASAGITTTPGTVINGNVAVSPIAGSSMTGFGLEMDQSGQFSRSASVVGHVYAADYASPTPDNLTSAVQSMGAAYDDAYGRLNPNFVELNAGNISGMTLVPGLYRWSSGLLINGELTLEGGVNDVIILQIAQTITVGTNAKVILKGGLQAKNVVFVAAEAITLGVGSQLEGIILCKTNVTVQTNASVNGRIYAGTAITLDNNLISQK